MISAMLSTPRVFYATGGRQQYALQNEELSNHQDSGKECDLK